MSRVKLVFSDLEVELDDPETTLPDLQDQAAGLLGDLIKNRLTYQRLMDEGDEGDASQPPDAALASLEPGATNTPGMVPLPPENIDNMGYI